MKLYHGSNLIVKNPQILTPNRNLDFGKGFYCTANKRQADSFSRIVVQRRGGTEIVSVYEFDKMRAYTDLRVKRFPAPDSSWLSFVMAHRSGNDSNELYDIVWGPVADDRVYMTLVLFAGGSLSEAETLARLQINKLYNQIVFTSAKSLTYLQYLYAIPEEL